MKRKLTKVEKFLLIAVALAGSFYFYLDKIYDPKIHSFEKTREEISTMQQQILALGETPNTRRMADKVAGEKEQLAVLEEKLAEEAGLKKARSESEVSKYLEEVNSLVLKNGLVVQQESFRSIRGPGEGVGETEP